jgi:hypothetical protein
MSANNLGYWPYDNFLCRVSFRRKNHYKTLRQLKSRFMNDTFFSFLSRDEKYNKTMKKEK